MSRKDEPKQYPIGGYAPGNYMCNCSTCKTQFQGDKRAVQCEPCAVKMIQKQHLIDMMKGDEELGLYDEIQPEQIWNKEKMEGIKQLIQDHKQETLEEAKERYLDSPTPHSYRLAVEFGAKWQMERYEEDMREEQLRNALLGINLVNPAHLEMTINGYGEFPDSYKLTEKGISYIIEQFKKK